MSNKLENIIDLNGKWKYITDVNDTFQINDISQMVHTIKDKMDIPSNWQLQNLINYSGSVWFIKRFSGVETVNDIKIIEFYGVDYFADVWLNNNYLGHHEGYFQRFRFNITNSLLPKENILVVKVNSPFEQPGKVWPLKKKAIKGVLNHHDCRPGAWNPEKGQDKNTGGIWNDVLIHYGLPVFIEQVKISSKVNIKNKSAQVYVKIKHTNFDNINKNFNAQIEITNPEGTTEIFSLDMNRRIGQNSSEIMLSLSNIYFWQTFDTGKPFLYNIKITSNLFNIYSCQYGFKKVKLAQDNTFFLNNKKLFLKGTNLIAEQLLSSLSNTRIQKIVTLIREANINVVRVHAHINRDELYSEFDRQGILVWQDFALQWTYEESKEFHQNAVSQIKDMVNQLYNHTSIAFWCCHNEPGPQIKVLDRELEKAVKNEDNQRIIRRASNYEEHPYEGWYWGVKEHYIAAPMGPLVTEFGAQALPNLNSLKKFIKDDDLFPPNFEIWEYHDFQPDQTFNIAKVNIGDSIEEFINNSQKYQAELLTTAIHYYRRKKYNGITGIFQFMFVDCWPSITWSVVDYYLTPKSGYYNLKQAYLPILLSINVRQNQYFLGSKLNLDLWIINDTYNIIQDCKIEFTCNKVTFCTIENLSVKEDNMYFIPFERINVPLPSDISEGNQFISANLMNSDGQVLSSYDFLIKVLAKDIKRIREEENNTRIL